MPPPTPPLDGSKTPPSKPANQLLTSPQHGEAKEIWHSTVRPRTSQPMKCSPPTVKIPSTLLLYPHVPVMTSGTLTRTPSIEHTQPPALRRRLVRAGVGRRRSGGLEVCVGPIRSAWWQAQLC